MHTPAVSKSPSQPPRRKHRQRCPNRLMLAEKKATHCQQGQPDFGAQRDLTGALRPPLWACYPAEHFANFLLPAHTFCRGRTSTAPRVADVKTGVLRGEAPCPGHPSRSPQSASSQNEVLRVAPSQGAAVLVAEWCVFPLVENLFKPRFQWAQG